jgi:hypothetical protein
MHFLGKATEMGEDSKNIIKKIMKFIKYTVLIITSAVILLIITIAIWLHFVINKPHDNRNASINTTNKTKAKCASDYELDTISSNINTTIYTIFLIDCKNDDLVKGIKYDTETLLKYAGISLVTNNNESHNAIMKMQCRFISFGAYYKPEKGGAITYRYSGAKVSGTMSFKKDDIMVYNKTFTGKVDIPYEITDMYRLKVEAPYMDALENAKYGSHLTKMIADLFGTKALIRSMINAICCYSRFGEDINHTLIAIGPPIVPDLIDTIKKEWLNNLICGLDIKINIVEIFGKIKDKRAVPILIDLLYDSSSFRLQGRAAWALGEINDINAIEPLKKALKSYKFKGHFEALRAIEKLSLGNNDPEGRTRRGNIPFR